jgi:hypothetical protein
MMADLSYLSRSSSNRFVEPLSDLPMRIREYSLFTRYLLAIYTNTRYLPEYSLFTRILAIYSLFTRILAIYATTR